MQLRLKPRQLTMDDLDAAKISLSGGVEGDHWARGCSDFIARHDRDACVFVNTGAGKRLRLRGANARVVKDGRLSVGENVTKLGERS